MQSTNYQQMQQPVAQYPQQQQQQRQGGYAPPPIGMNGAPQVVYVQQAYQGCQHHIVQEFVRLFAFMSTKFSCVMKTAGARRHDHLPVLFQSLSSNITMSLSNPSALLRHRLAFAVACSSSQLASSAALVCKRTAASSATKCFKPNER